MFGQKCKCGQREMQMVSTNRASHFKALTSVYYSPLSRFETMEKGQKDSFQRDFRTSPTRVGLRCDPRPLLIEDTRKSLQKCLLGASTPFYVVEESWADVFAYPRICLALLV